MNQHSMGKHSDVPNAGALWDFLYSDSLGPRLSLSFEGDPHAWEQVKEMALARGLKPSEVLQIAMYEYLEGPSRSAAARARFMAHREWERTRPVLLIDAVGSRYVPADLLFADKPVKG